MFHLEKVILMSSLQMAKVLVESVDVEERKGTDVLVVEDGNGIQYTTPRDYIVNTVSKRDREDDRYVGRRWFIAYQQTDEGFYDFWGFLAPVPSRGGGGDSEKVEDLMDRVEKLEELLENQGGSSE